MIITIYTPKGVKELDNFDVSEQVQEVTYEEMLKELELEE